MKRIWKSGVRIAISLSILICSLRANGQSEAEKKPSDMNGRIIVKNPELPEKQKQPPIIIAPQFVMHKKKKHAKVIVENHYVPFFSPS